MEELSQKAVLFIIDVQKGFDAPAWGLRNNCDAESNIVRLLKAWRQTGRPVAYLQNMQANSKSPLSEKKHGNDIKDEVKPEPGEPIFQKQGPSHPIDTHLEDYLLKHDFRTLVLVGLTTDHSIYITAVAAHAFGIETYVVADATATFNRIDHKGIQFSAEQVHAVALASMHNEYATICNTADFFNILGLERVTTI